MEVVKFQSTKGVLRISAEAKKSVSMYNRDGIYSREETVKSISLNHNGRRYYGVILKGSVHAPKTSMIGQCLLDIAFAEYESQNKAV